MKYLLVLGLAVCAALLLGGCATTEEKKFPNMEKMESWHSSDGRTDAYFCSAVVPNGDDVALHDCDIVFTSAPSTPPALGGGGCQTDEKGVCLSEDNPPASASDNATFLPLPNVSLSDIAPPSPSYYWHGEYCLMNETKFEWRVFPDDYLKDKDISEYPFSGCAPASHLTSPKIPSGTSLCGYEEIVPRLVSPDLCPVKNWSIYEACGNDYGGYFTDDQHTQFVCATGTVGVLEVLENEN